jgi:ParB family chromosome partitioning protein
MSGGNDKRPAPKGAPEKKRGLGRGFDALFGGPVTRPPVAAPTTEGSTPPTATPLPQPELDARRHVLSVPIEKVQPNKDQPRRDFDPAALAELAASIREHGLLQPILVRKKDDGYEIIAGERRWRATQQAGRHEIDVLVQELAEPDVYVWALIENIQREDLNAIELARAYKQLIDERGLTQDQLAEIVGKDRATIANALRLMKLPLEVQRQVVAGALSMGHARALLGLDDEKAIVKLAKDIVARGLSVREVERLVKNLREPPEAESEADADRYASIPGGANAVRRETEALIRRLGAKVRIQVAGRRGRIEIDFGSPNELDRIITLLKGDR